jgi:hypothetical protein
MTTATISAGATVGIVIGVLVLGVGLLWLFLKFVFAATYVLEEISKTSQLPVDIIVNNAEGKVWACEQSGHRLHVSQRACPHDGSRAIWRYPNLPGSPGYQPPATVGVAQQAATAAVPTEDEMVTAALSMYPKLGDSEARYLASKARDLISRGRAKTRAEALTLAWTQIRK